MAGDLVTVRSFNLPWQADLCRARLAEQGIRAWINEDRSALINYLWANALGGIEVQAADFDAQRANSVLGDSAVVPRDSRRLLRMFVWAYLGLTALVTILVLQLAHW